MLSNAHGTWLKIKNIPISYYILSKQNVNLLSNTSQLCNIHLTYVLNSTIYIYIYITK